MLSKKNNFYQYLALTSDFTYFEYFATYLYQNQVNVCGEDQISITDNWYFYMAIKKNIR